MKPRVQEESRQEDLFRARLKNIINLEHKLVRLAELLDWSSLETHFAAYYSEIGRPGTSIRAHSGVAFVEAHREFIG